jgi:hypothetical protein
MNGLEAIAFVAERKIQEAMDEGLFDNLPGMGRPLELDDLSHLPPDMRMAYTILKSGGFLEKETAPGKMTGMKELLAAVPDEGRVYGKMQRLKVMMHRVRRAESRFMPEAPAKAHAELEDSPYWEKLVDRV